ncbi:MAG: hypothetical protein ACRCWM_06195 [Sarcina sp.]
MNNMINILGINGMFGICLIFVGIVLVAFVFEFLLKKRESKNIQK